MKEPYVVAQIDGSFPIGQGVEALPIGELLARRRDAAGVASRTVAVLAPLAATYT